MVSLSSYLYNLHSYTLVTWHLNIACHGPLGAPAETNTFWVGSVNFRCSFNCCNRYCEAGVLLLVFFLEKDVPFRYILLLARLLYYIKYVFLHTNFCYFLQDRSRAHFKQGDACNLPLDLGQYGCVLAANLICRLHRPQGFLDRLASLVAPGGILVLTSPYTFMTEYTPKVGAVQCYKGTWALMG